MENIFEWIDKEMKFDFWYKVKTEKQKNTIIKLMDSGLITDCEFNDDYTKFRKSKTANELLYPISNFESSYEFSDTE